MTVSVHPRDSAAHPLRSPRLVSRSRSSCGARSCARPGPAPAAAVIGRLCNGVVVPLAPQTETIIEYLHRLTSGAAMLLALGLVVGSRLAFPAGHRARTWAAAAFGVMLLEAALGAGLVLLRARREQQSAARAAYIGLHLANTMLLTGVDDRHDLVGEAAGRASASAGAIARIGVLDGRCWSSSPRPAPRSRWATRCFPPDRSARACRPI